MPIETDLSVSPYFNDYNVENNYHQVLFKPSVAVQAREMNNLQSMLQKQIEIFGNNVFKRGTIIDGCNFAFYDNYPYVKIKDTLIDGTTAFPTNYVGYFVKNSTNLKAKIINAVDGFESSDPDLKTLYLNYINSGNSFNESTYASGQILTIYDANNSIHSIGIESEGIQYSNNDTIIITPVLLANVTSGTLEVGDTITDPASGANGVITSVEQARERKPIVKLGGTVSFTSGGVDITGTSTTFSNDFANGDYIALYSNTTAYELHKINVVTSNTVMNVTSNITFSNTAASYANVSPSEIYIQYSPLAVDLSNANSNSNNWTFNTGNTIQGSVSTDTATILEIIGSNASAGVVTDAVGKIIATSISNRGTGYTKVPYASVKSVNGTSAELVARNYVGQLTVASTIGAVGSGYAFGVSRGYIYQKGYFVRVNPQTVIVDKYSRSPNNVAVSFKTNEETINSNQDTNLVDNALGAPNENAPGADRLKLTANLVTTDLSNTSLAGNNFILVEWSNGVPYKQNQQTAYNVINDYIAKRTRETDGNYVIDEFLVTTTSPANTSLEGNTFNIVVDPGTAYIDGYRLETKGNYVASVEKATGTKLFENSKLSINYENYVRVNELGGYFEFDQANLVDLYDTAKNFLSDGSSVVAGNTNPTGTKIGTARIRNFVHEQGTFGSPDAIYRLYLFDIKMNEGKNFRSVRSIHFNGTSFDGIADTFLENDPTTNTDVAVIYGENNKLVFDTGYISLKNANNITYQYRTIDEQSIANSGQLQISLIPISKKFPYTGTLTDSQKQELYIAPNANLVAFDTLTGDADVYSNTTIDGNSTAFLSELKVGDYLEFADGSNTDIRRVTSIANNTRMSVDSNVAFTASAVELRKAWPENVPINLAYDSNYTANVDSNSEVLTIDLLANSSNGLNTSTNTSIFAAYNVEVENASATPKSVNRNVFVKLQLSNNAAGSDGPWCLGVPDIFRLKKVYKGSSSSVSESDLDITSEFYIDHNQTANYYDLGYLYKRNGSSLRLTEDDFLLVKFDCFTASPGFYTTTSYVSSVTSERIAEDSKPLSELTNTINTMEIPEIFIDNGKYFDLINCIDFRPYVANTATLATTTGTATLNPANTFTFSASDRYFPVPDSIMDYDAEKYMPRRDNIVIEKNGLIKTEKGVNETGLSPNVPRGTLMINTIDIPSYPNMPYNKSDTLIEILDKRMANQLVTNQRIMSHEIKTVFKNQDLTLRQPRNYTQSDIGNIDRRLKAVEYYVSFNLLQNEIKNRVIPSSISPTIDRFKYGFFSDEYDNDINSEYRSPEYSATVRNSFVTPPELNLNVVHANNDASSVPYSNYEIINQNIATTEVVIPPPPPIITYEGVMTIEPNTLKNEPATYNNYPTYNDINGSNAGAGEGSDGGAPGVGTGGG